MLRNFSFLCLSKAVALLHSKLSRPSPFSPSLHPSLLHTNLENDPHLSPCLFVFPFCCLTFFVTFPPLDYPLSLCMDGCLTVVLQPSKSGNKDSQPKTKESSKSGIMCALSLFTNIYVYVISIYKVPDMFPSILPFCVAHAFPAIFNFSNAGDSSVAASRKPPQPAKVIKSKQRERKASVCVRETHGGVLSAVKLRSVLHVMSAYSLSLFVLSFVLHLVVGIVYARKRRQTTRKSQIHTLS